MKLLHIYVALSTSLVPTFGFSQAGVAASQPFPSSPVSAVTQARDVQNTQPLTVMGKVASEDGASIEQGISVVLQCGGSERARIGTDRKGDFALSLRLLQSESMADIGSRQAGMVTTQEWNQCELYGEAPGYVSEPFRMFGQQSMGLIQAGTIVLHRLAKAESTFSVSAVSLAAPDKAKKDFQKGQEQENKGKWESAREYFRKAVEVYPRYALAWLELGRTELRQNNFTEAQQSFNQAAQQDPRFIDAYVQIASLAALRKEWKELADATQHIVELSPDSTAKYWFLNAAANFNLGNLANAETSATRGLRLDSKHEVPQLEYLYGIIRARVGDYSAAVEHLQTYLRLMPHASDAADVQAKLAAVQKLAVPQNTASR